MKMLLLKNRKNIHESWWNYVINRLHTLITKTIFYHYFWKKIFPYFRNLQVMKRPGPGKLETLFGSEKVVPRALKPPTLGPPWPEEKSTKAPPLVTQVKIPPPNIVPHPKPPSNRVSTKPPTRIPKPPITPSPFHPKQQDPKKSQKKRVLKVLQVLYKIRALHPQFQGLYNTGWFKKRFWPCWLEPR